MADRTAAISPFTAFRVLLEDALLILGDRKFSHLAGKLGVLKAALALWVAIRWLTNWSRRAAESSSQMISPFLTLVPSGMILIIVVRPSTLQ